MLLLKDDRKLINSHGYVGINRWSCSQSDHKISL